MLRNSFHSSRRKTPFVNAGFTLIELLVVISIIGLLSSIVLASVNTARAKARDARRVADIKEIEKALQLFYDANGSYPDETTADGSIAGWEASTRGNFMEYLEPYLAKIPKDPLNQDTGTINMFFSPRPQDGNFFYVYHRYETNWSCPNVPPYSKGYAVLGVRAFETKSIFNLPKAACGPDPCTGGPYPGFNPPTCRDWSGEYDYSIFLFP